MIRIDLADPLAPVGPPPAWLLMPTLLLMGLLPLLAAAGAYLMAERAASRSGDVAHSIAALETHIAAATAKRRRMDELESLASAADRLRDDAQRTLALVPALTSRLRPGMHLAEISITQAGIRISGTARSASDLSGWLADSAAVVDGLSWGAPELRQASTPDPRVEFAVDLARARVERKR